MSGINTVAYIITGLGIRIKEHVAAFWKNDFHVYQWYSNIVEEIIPP